MKSKKITTLQIGDVIVNTKTKNRMVCVGVIPNRDDAGTHYEFKADNLLKGKHWQRLRNTYEAGELTRMGYITTSKQMNVRQLTALADENTERRKKMSTPKQPKSQATKHRDDDSAKLFGFRPRAVARKLKSVGLNNDQVIEILKARKVTSLNFDHVKKISGKCKLDSAAPLTGAQVAELKKLATAPSKKKATPKKKVIKKKVAAKRTAKKTTKKKTRTAKK